LIVESLVTGNLWLWLPVVIMGCFYITAAIEEERKFLSSELAGKYKKYRKRSGMFLSWVG